MTSETPIDSLPPFTEPGDWRTLMATLAEPALCAQIAAQSQVLNEPWMRLIVDGGLLRLPEVCKTTSNDFGAFVDGIDAWTKRVEDFTRFTTQSTMATLRADDDEDIFVLRNGGSEGARHIYAQATPDLMADYQTLLAHPRANQTARVAESLHTMATWLAGAIVLDLPDTVKAMVTAVPEIAQGLVDINALGSDMDEYLFHRERDNGTKRDGILTAGLTAQGVALTLSREACLEALWASGVSPLSRLGEHRTVNSVSNGADGPDVHAEDIFTDNLSLNMFVLCTPQAWEKALKQTMEHPRFHGDRRDKLCAMALDDIARDDREWMAPYVPSLANAGVYGIDPVESMRVAGCVGALQVLNSVLPLVDWNSQAVDDAFTEHHSPLLNACGKVHFGVNDDRENGILALMDAAVAAGRSDLIAPQVLEANGGEYLVPLFDFAGAGFHRAIVKYIDNGWDPKKNPPHCDDVPSLLKYADKMAPEVAHTIRTHEARAKAYGALNDIEKAAPKQGAR